MYLVIGNTPKRVELRDLNDSVYYKQQKLFTDAQYAQSSDLKREIQRGALTVLKRTEETSGTFEVPSVVIANSVSDKVAALPPADSSKLDALLERIQALEESINSKNSAPSEEKFEHLTVLNDKVQKMEKELSNTGNENVLSVVFDAIKSLEQKINQSSNDAILQKLSELVNRAPVVINSPSTEAAPNREEVKPEDIYVPNISVEDANTHIKLQVRTIESGDNMSDSLKKLKELKSKSK
jgi:hypothetical protein